MRYNILRLLYEGGVISKAHRAWPSGPKQLPWPETGSVHHRLRFFLVSSRVLRSLFEPCKPVALEPMEDIPDTFAFRAPLIHPLYRMIIVLSSILVHGP